MGRGNHKRPPSSSSATSRRKFRRKSPGNYRRFSNSSTSSAFASSSREIKPRKHTPPTTNQTPMLRPVNPSPRPDWPTHSALPPIRIVDPTPAPAPAPAFGFVIERTLVLTDGSVRTYFALPPDNHDFSPLPPREFRGPVLGFDGQLRESPELRPYFRGDPYLHSRNEDYRDSLGLEGQSGVPVTSPGDENSTKRKFLDDEREATDDFDRKRQHLLQLANVDDNSPGMSENGDLEEIRTGEENALRHKHHEIDQKALNKAFLHFAKSVYGSEKQKNRYLANGKRGHFQCIVCGRNSKHFSDMHSLIMHAYHSDNAESSVDHLGFHKALCVLKGWNYSTPPDSSKSYQLLPANEVVANQDDLIIWPPLVIIHNIITGKREDASMEGLENNAMDEYLRDIGCKGGKPISKGSLSKDGSLGITIVEFASGKSGLKEAMRLAEYFQRSNHGRSNWTIVKPLTLLEDEENNQELVKVDPLTGEKKRVFYGYLANVSDLDKINVDTRKKVSIESKTELLRSL